MAKIPAIGANLLKHAPWLAVILAVYQYYKDTGGVQGFMDDIKNLNMSTLQSNWTKIGMGIAFFVGADVVSRYVPGKLKYVVKAIMYYFGASQMLEVVNVMYTPPGEVVGSGGAAVEVRGY